MISSFLVMLIAFVVFLVISTWVNSNRQKDGEIKTSDVFIWILINMITYGIVVIYFYEKYLREWLKWY